MKNDTNSKMNSSNTPMAAESNEATLCCYDQLKLDNQLCFSLYVCSKEIIKKYKPILDPYGLTYTGYIILMALWEEDNVTVKELGKKLFLDSGTLTPLLKKLEALEYITRARSSKDERNVYIELTQKGKDFKEEALSIPQKLICSFPFDANKASSLIEGLHDFMERIAFEE